MKHPQTVTVYPEKNENKAAYRCGAPCARPCLRRARSIALMVIWNVDLKGLFVLPLGGAVTVLLGCIAGDYLGAKKNIYRAAAAVPWLVFLPVCFVTGNPLSGGMSWVNRLITRWNAAHEGGRGTAADDRPRRRHHRLHIAFDNAVRARILVVYARRQTRSCCRLLPYMGAHRACRRGIQSACNGAFAVRPARRVYLLQSCLPHAARRCDVGGHSGVSYRFCAGAACGQHLRG